jgi:TolB-like protein/Tfp pilus assembly protein PilF
MAIWTSEIKELEKLYESLKGQLPDLEKELERLIKADDENMILLYSRRCLEVIITDLCECELKRPRKTEPLKGIIDKLNKEGKVPSHIIASMHGLNELSTYGTHPKDFDPEQVKPVLNNLDIIIKWYLRYKEIGTDIKTKPTEAIKQDIKSSEDAKKIITISKRRLTGLVSGLILLIVIVVAVLLLTDIIGIGKQTKEVEKSIAVLPFHNFSEDLNQELKSDALTNEIINHLYKIKSFTRVAPFLSVQVYRKTNKKNILIADELNVNYLLDGTYQKIEDSLKITVNLIEPKSDKYLWQNDYYEPYKEIISIQSDIALHIASHVNAFLTIPEKQDILKRPTNNQEAYDLLQQAIINHFKALGDPNYDVTDNFFVKSKNLASKAIELDPNYADAYAWAGLFSVNAGAYSGNKEMSVAALEALPFIEKALELDQNNSQAHFTMANINEWGQWDYINAEKEYLKVFELSPNKSQYYSTVGEFFLKMNQLDKAIFFSKKAFESEFIDPTSVLIETLILSGNKVEAISTMEKYLKSQRNPDYQRVGECLIWMEEYDSARFYLETALKNDVPEMLVPRFQACLAFAYSKTKNPHQAQTIINQIINKSKKTSAMSPDYFIGWYYSRIGEVDSAFYWLEKAYKSRSAEMPWLKVDPAFKNLKNDNRYWNLYQRTGHKAYDDYRASLKE